jgi:hypothetical protein
MLKLVFVLSYIVKLTLYISGSKNLDLITRRAIVLLLYSSAEGNWEHTQHEVLETFLPNPNP